MRQEVEPYCVPPTATVRDVILCIDRNGKGIALVTDAEGRLFGTLTDGDVRRAILAGLQADDPVSALLARKVGSDYPRPVTAPAGSDREMLLRIMREHVIRQVPLLDTEGRVSELVVIDQWVPVPTLPLQAVIMAGGYGDRLRPLTDDVPKSMLPVGDRPLLERMIEQLRQSGIRRVHVATHYRSDQIVRHFRDGKDFGVEISYTTEREPMGTAGALGMVPVSDEPLLVINGDILTRVDFRAMLEYHREHRAELTVGICQYGLKVPYGVVECEGALVRRIREKPQLQFLVNAGIYLLQPAAARRVPGGDRYDMTELIQGLLDEGSRIASFPIVEYWLDVGNPDAYRRAQEDVRSGRLSR